MKTIALDCESTIEAKQQLRVITIQEDGKQPEVVYRYDLHGASVPESVISLIEESRIIAHNSWFDVGVLGAYGIRPKAVWCTMTAEMAIRTNKSVPNLADIVDKYIGIVLEKDEQKSDWSQELTDKQVEYCHNDVKYLLKIYNTQKKYLEHTGAITHVELKNTLIREWSTDLYYGAAVNVDKLTEIGRLARNQYRAGISELIEHLPPILFFKSTVTCKGFKAEMSPYSAKVVEMKSSKVLMNEFFNDTENQELLIEYIVSNPFSDILVDVAQAAFAKKVGVHLNVNCKSFAKNSPDMNQYLMANPTSPFADVMELLMKLRKASKLISTYTTVSPDKSYQDRDGITRLKLKNTYTVSGRIGLYPLSVMPKPDEDDEDKRLHNMLRDAFITPKGYVSIALDYSSVEDIVAGIMWNDEAKLKIVEQGYDQYLMLAAKMCGIFEYTDPAQTKDLKKKYAGLRQGFKPVALGRNYCASAKKLESEARRAFEKAGIEFKWTGEQLNESWEATYVGIATAQKNMNSFLVNTLTETLDSYDYDRWESRLVREFNLDKFSNSSKLRSDVFRDSGLMVCSHSVLGLRRDWIAHRDYSTFSLGSKKARITDISNYTIQSTSGEALWLAIILIKILFPSLVVPFAIHDSIIAYCPEGGIKTDKGIITVEQVKKSLQSLMAVAGWMLVGRGLKADGDVVTQGF